MCTCCFGTVEGESCGWPKGTVRAVIALITIPLGFVTAITIIILLVVKEQYLVAVGINGVVWGLIGTIIGYYYGSRSAEGAAKMISDIEHEITESRNMEIARSLEIHRGDQNHDNPDNTDEPLLEVI